MLTEFQIRAWQKDQTHAQVLVHSSPAGDIRKPLTVPCDLRRLDDDRKLVSEIAGGLWIPASRINSST